MWPASWAKTVKKSLVPARLPMPDRVVPGLGVVEPDRSDDGPPALFGVVQLALADPQRPFGRAVVAQGPRIADADVDDVLGRRLGVRGPG